MMNGYFSIIAIPVSAGIIELLLSGKRIKDVFFISALILNFICSIFIFLKPPPMISFNLIGDFSFSLGLVGLAYTILLFINLFGLLIGLYSTGYFNPKEKSKYYYAFYLLLIGFANLVILSLDFLSFLFGWGTVLILLYTLLSLDNLISARKALYILGIADFLLILGISLYIANTKQFLMPIQYGLELKGIIPWLSFISLLIGALAKAGCVPFQSWIPTASETTSIPTMVVLPASLDKLLGIYLLFRICTDFFVLNIPGTIILMVIGALTIIFAVMSALVQHDLRKLLSFHAISQVGYMVLGLGIANPLGIAGGVFHMINNVIYKSGLFLSGGYVGKRRGTFSLDELGGLGKFLPFTFLFTLIFAFSISGVPPFNGFASKWMIYQGLFEKLQIADHGLRSVVIFCLIIAMFGSVFTLASFVKFIHAIFLSEEKNAKENKLIRTSSVNMVFPMFLLSLLCIFLGVFPYRFVNKFILKYLPQNLSYIGNWHSTVVFILFSGIIIIGSLYGLYLNKKVKFMRKDESFIGTENIKEYFSDFPATEFYRTLEDNKIANTMSYLLQSEGLDFYNLVCNLFRKLSFLIYYLFDRFIYILTNLIAYTVLLVSDILKKLHTGNLDLYVTWSLLSLIVLFFMLIK